MLIPVRDLSTNAHHVRWAFFILNLRGLRRASRYEDQSMGARVTSNGKIASSKRAGAVYDAAVITRTAAI